MRVVKEVGSEIANKVFTSPRRDWNSLRFLSVSYGYWKGVNSQRRALENFGRDFLGIKQLDDWYLVSASHVHKELSFIKKTYGSLYEALKNLYPKHNWDPLRFSRIPRGHWSDKDTQRAALERLGRKLGVKELDDWYSVSARKVNSKLDFIQKEYGSLFTALHTLYPQHNWDQMRFANVPRGYWTDVSKQKEALEKFGREQLGVKELDDWYSVPSKRVYSELSFVGKYGSLFNALKKFYPQHDWDPLRFSRAPSRYWADENIQREALERFGREQLGVKELDDWYSVSAVMVYNELSFLKNYYNGSLFDALKKLYPHHEWDPLRFSRVPHRSWALRLHRDALETFGREQLGVKDLDDWYSLSTVDVRELGFINKYGTLFDALKKLYPQHKWDPLRFSRIPHGHWKHRNTVQRYHDILQNWKNTYDIRTVSDWYELSPQQIRLFERVSKGIFGSKMRMLQEWFPDIVRQSQHTAQLELRGMLKHVIASANVKNFADDSVIELPSKTQKEEEERNKWNNTWSKILNNLQLRNHSETVDTLGKL